MKINKLEIIVIGGVLMFTFTGCANKETAEVPVMSEAVVEMATEEDLGTVAGGLYAEDTEIADGQEAEISEEYTIDFVDAGNEDIEAEQGDTITIPEYERQKMMPLLPDIFENFTVDSEDFEVLEETENTDGSSTYLVKIVSDNIVQSVTTQYSVDIETGKAKALFVYQVPSEIEITAADLGLNFEVTVQEDGTVTVDKILDLYKNDVSDITYFNGTCIGWSMTKWANEVDFEFGDTISVSQNLALYPVMDLTNAFKEGDDFEVGTWVNSYNGTAIQIGDTFDGTAFDAKYCVVDGKVIDKEGTTVVDTETGVVTTAKTETSGKGNGSASGKGTSGIGSESESGKGTEQSSTVGGTGHTEEPAANPEYVPSDEPNQMDPTEAAAKFGMTFGGSGREGGNNVGNGGYGLTFE